ncbi:MAG: hypothetical protein ACRETM_13960 [Stenotrophobium sp.]
MQDKNDPVPKVYFAPIVWLSICIGAGFAFLGFVGTHPILFHALIQLFPILTNKVVDAVFFILAIIAVLISLRCARKSMDVIP